MLIKCTRLHIFNIFEVLHLRKMKIQLYGLEHGMADSTELHKNETLFYLDQFFAVLVWSNSFICIKKYTHR